jgi:FKBP-type peptidyl-prolyl cis-trans isomerase
MFRIGVILAAMLYAFAAPALAADASLSPAANAAFLAANAKQAGVHVQPSGLQYKILQNGFGMRPGPNDTVTVDYKGTLINGKLFDGTEPGLPAQLPLNGLIPGWQEALSIMRVGDHWQIVIPANLGYGNRAAGDAIPPNQTLVFDLHLIAATPPPPKEKDDKDSH